MGRKTAPFRKSSGVRQGPNWPAQLRSLLPFLLNFCNGSRAGTLVCLPVSALSAALDFFFFQSEGLNAVLHILDKYSTIELHPTPPVLGLVLKIEF